MAARLSSEERIRLYPTNTYLQNLDSLALVPDNERFSEETSVVRLVDLDSPEFEEMGVKREDTILVNRLPSMPFMNDLEDLFRDGVTHHSIGSFMAGLIGETAWGGYQLPATPEGYAYAGPNWEWATKKHQVGQLPIRVTNESFRNFLQLYVAEEETVSEIELEPVVVAHSGGLLAIYSALDMEPVNWLTMFSGETFDFVSFQDRGTHGYLDIGFQNPNARGYKLFGNNEITEQAVDQLELSLNDKGYEVVARCTLGRKHEAENRNATINEFFGPEEEHHEEVDSQGELVLAYHGDHLHIYSTDDFDIQRNFPVYFDFSNNTVRNNSVLCSDINLRVDLDSVISFQNKLSQEDVDEIAVHLEGLEYNVAATVDINEEDNYLSGVFDDVFGPTEVYQEPEPKVYIAFEEENDSLIFYSNRPPFGDSGWGRAMWDSDFVNPLLAGNSVNQIGEDLRAYDFLLDDSFIKGEVRLNKGLEVDDLSEIMTCIRFAGYGVEAGDREFGPSYIRNDMGIHFGIIIPE